MYFDLFERACKEVGIAPTRLLVDLGIGKTAIYNWKNGSEPSNRTQKQIADYFGVTPTEFLEGKIKKLGSSEEAELINNILANKSKKAQDEILKFLNRTRQMTDGQLEALNDLADIILSEKVK